MRSMSNSNITGCAKKYIPQSLACDLNFVYMSPMINDEWNLVPNPLTLPNGNAGFMCRIPLYFQ